MNKTDEFITKTKVLKNSIDLLNQFFQILGEFNPAVIDIKISSKEKIDVETVTANYPKEFYNVKTVKIDNIEDQLTENFNWLKTHIIQYGAADFLKKPHNSFNKDCFDKLLDNIRLQVLSYSKNYNNKGIEVLADSRDGSYYRDLLIHGENKSLLIYFANVIH